MTRYLVDKTKDLVFYRNSVFNTPTNGDIRNGVGNRKGIKERRIEIASDLGAVFINGDEILCRECSHNSFMTKATKIAENNPNVILIESSDISRFCQYSIKDEGPQWLSYFYRTHNGTEIGFAARMNPCVIDTGLLLALYENDFLNKFQLKGIKIDPKIFPYVRDINQNSDSEKEAIRLYSELQIRKRSQIRNLIGLFRNN